MSKKPIPAEVIERVLDELEDEMFEQAELLEPGTPLDYRIVGKQDLIKLLRARLNVRRRG